jgi:hypothetical protein
VFAALVVAVTLLFVSAPAVPDASTVIVSNNGNAGTGSFRAALAQCPEQIEFGYTGYEILIAATLTVRCPHPVAIDGNGNTVVNRGGGDGIAILSHDVTVTNLGVRGTTAAQYGDIAVRSVWNVTLRNVRLGLDGNGLDAPPATYRTGTSLLWIQDSTGIVLDGVEAGWNVNFWGALVFQNAATVEISNTNIRGASYGTVGPTTLDAIALVYGTRDVHIDNITVRDTSSSSAIELHTADRVTITDSTLSGSGRAGVTVFDARDVKIVGVTVDGAGTCGTELADQGAVAVYPNSLRVTVTASTLLPSCGFPAIALL